jgi:hypothetical protein
MASTINASTSAGLVQTADTSGILQLQTNSGTTAVTIDTSQNVGIGTTTPASKLHVNGNVAINTSANNSKLGIYVDSISDFAIGYGANFDNYITAGASGTTIFRTSSTERMRIDSSGNVNIGITGIADRLAVYYTRATQQGITIRTSADTGGGNAMLFTNAAGSLVGYISTTASTTTYSTSSDYRLKENIAPMTGALDKVAQLKPVTYTWKIDGTNGQGFIAHELQEVVPDCVGGEKDAIDAEGNPQYQGIDTSFLVATLTAAIQELAKASSEQQALITSLTARITALESATSQAPVANTGGTV